MKNITSGGWIGSTKHVRTYNASGQRLGEEGSEINARTSPGTFNRHANDAD
ncbi:MAG: hypothetical protein LBL33_02635 [Tannerella sp.]|nr:hypothetical protein [Tannerella sp.]